MTVFPSTAAFRLLASMVLLSTLLAGGVSGADRHELADGEYSLYKGKASLKQTSQGQTLADVKYTGNALVTRQADRLVFARSTHDASGAVAGAIIDRYLISKESKDWIPFETQQELDVPRRDLAIYFPFALEISFEAKPGKVSGTVSALSQIPTTADFDVAVTTEGDVRTVTRTLAKGTQASFTFNRLPSQLTAWSEVFRFRAGALIAWSQSSDMKLGKGDDAIQVATSASADLADSGKLTGAKGYRLESGLETLKDLQGEFAKRVASADMRNKVKAFSDKNKDTVARVLADVALSHLGAYASTYESGAAAQLLGRLLGKSPIDFALKDLEGKEHRISELIKGRVAYLTFWGVG